MKLRVGFLCTENFIQIATNAQTRHIEHLFL